MDQSTLLLSTKTKLSKTSLPTPMYENMKTLAYFELHSSADIVTLVHLTLGPCSVLFPSN